MSPGYILAQTIHGASQYFLDHFELAKKWNNNYLISLSVASEEKLQILLNKLFDMDIPVSYFTEPDRDDELTSIVFIETEATVRLTSHLPLALKDFNYDNSCVY